MLGEASYNFIVHSSGRSSPLYSSSSAGLRRDEETNTQTTSEKMPNAHANPKLNLNRDFTKELFTQLEKKIFTPNQQTELNSSSSSIANQTVTEARYDFTITLHSEIIDEDYSICILLAISVM